jgi:hypothetical protein
MPAVVSQQLWMLWVNLVEKYLIWLFDFQLAGLIVDFLSLLLYIVIETICTGVYGNPVFRSRILDSQMGH